MSVFAKRLKEMRESKGLTRKELGKASGVDPSLISRYESGERAPTADNLLKIAKTLECSTDYLLGLTDNPQPWSNDLPESVKKQLERLQELENEVKKLKEVIKTLNDIVDKWG